MGSMWWCLCMESVWYRGALAIVSHSDSPPPEDEILILHSSINLISSWLVSTIYLIISYGWNCLEGARELAVEGFFA
jgi:hypothetical protein